MSIPYKANTKMPLTSQFFNQLICEKDLFDDQYQRSQKRFDISDDEQYYILSTKFMEQWRNLTSLVQEQSCPDPNKLFTLPGYMNQELIEQQLPEFQECVIKSEIQQGKDYLIVNRGTFQIFDLYEGLRIPRRAYYNGVTKMVERFPIKFPFIYISPSRLQKLQSTSNDNCISLHHSLAYKNETIQDLLYRMVEYSKKDEINRQDQYLNKTSSRIYVGHFTNLSDYCKSIKQIKINDSTKNTVELLQPPGQQLRKDMMIGDLNFGAYGAQLPVMVIELQQNKWVYKITQSSANQGYCQSCRKRSKLEHQCRCKQVAYCCKQCLERDWKYHSRSCSTQYQDDNQQPKFQFKQNSKRGLIGLQNLGNTCYLNSALQCILHTELLTKYFVDKLYLQEINQDNPIGSHGKIVKSYAKFIESAMTTEDDTVAPFKFKYIVGKQKDIFSGYQQHDAQQFLLFVLDTLHEDLNRVRKKPYTNSIENKGRPDYDVAKQSWLTYLKRNQSIVNDLMGGQYRSEVKCPDCSNISVTFDPYLIFSVPIPSTNQVKTLNMYFFFPNYQRQTLKMTVKSMNNSVSQLYEDVIQKVNDKTTRPLITLREIQFFILGFNGSIRIVKNQETVDRLINQKQYNQGGEQRQLFCLQFTDQELENIEQKKYLVFKFIDKQGNKALTFKRPFLMNCTNKITGKNLYDRICRFLTPLQAKSQPLSQKQLQNKYMVFREKVKQEKIFKIVMAYGPTKQITNHLIYPDRLEIEQQTPLNQLLVKNNYEVEFEIQFTKGVYYTFNSFKTYSSGSSWNQHHSYHSEKTGCEQSYTLYECLQEMKKSQKLLQGNQVFCAHCCDLKLAEKKMQMYKASKYLAIQLRRFKQVGYEKSKNYAEVVYDEYLDLSGYLLNYELPQVYMKQEQQSKNTMKSQQQTEQFFFKPKYSTQYSIDNKIPKYRLYGVVNHSGSLNGGHYTAYSRQNGKWYKFDDSYVSQLSNYKWNGGNDAYMLFYERLDNEDEWKEPVKYEKKKHEDVEMKQMHKEIEDDIKKVIDKMATEDNPDTAQKMHIQ